MGHGTNNFDNELNKILDEIHASEDLDFELKRLET